MTEAELKTTNMYFTLLTIGVSLILCVNAQQTITATCQLVSLSSTNVTVSGLLTLSQPLSGGNVSITGTLMGFTLGGFHGFHIHEFGNLSNQCNYAGVHYNPYNKSHGAPNDTERHVGDLGNIFVYDNMTSYVNIVDNVIQLQGMNMNNVVGLSIVVHSGVDDLGRGNNSASKMTGNSGYRIGCCVISQPMTINQTTPSSTVTPPASTTASRGSPVSDRPLATVFVLCLVAVQSIQKLVHGRMSG